jgi:hypothetical protein
MSFRGVLRLLVTSHHYPLKIELGEECLVTHHARNANKIANSADVDYVQAVNTNFI